MSYNIQIIFHVMTFIYVKLIIDVMESYVCDIPSLFQQGGNQNFPLVFFGGDCQHNSFLPNV
jgi:hypothetical protein